MVQSNYMIPTLPPPGNLETPEILRLLNKASRALGELKGEAKTIPNRQIPVNTLFRHPYTRIEYVEQELAVSRATATSYLNRLAQNGFVTKFKRGRNNYYINDALVRLFLEVSNDN